MTMPIKKLYKSTPKKPAGGDVPEYTDNVNMEAVQVIADASEHAPSGIDVHVKIMFNGGDLVACQVEHLSANQHLSRAASGPSTLVYRSPDETSRLLPRDLPVSDLKLTAASRILKPLQSLGLSTLDFRVYQLIGTGAQGSVFLVQHLANGRFYALKAIRKSVLKQSHFPFVFQEQLILKTVSGSPWFAHLRASFEDSKSFYLVTDFYPEGDLAKRIYKRGRFECDEALPYCAQLVLALEDLHNRRIMHRDLKPANVLITRDNNLVLSDFGFSRAYDLSAVQQPWRLRDEWAPHPGRPSAKSTMAKHKDLTRRDCGTIGYMAPEVCRGDWYTYSADIFSLGVVFFELMNGKLPYGIAHGNRDQRAVYEQMMTRQVETRLDVDLDAHNLLSWMLEKEPSRRPTLEQVKNHPWFASVKWKQLARRKLPAPLRPSSSFQPSDSAKYSSFGKPYLEGEAPHWWYQWLSPTFPLEVSPESRQARRASTAVTEQSPVTPRSATLPRSLSAVFASPVLPLLTPPASMYREHSPRGSTERGKRDSLAVPSPPPGPRSRSPTTAFTSATGKSNSPGNHGPLHSVPLSSRSGVARDSIGPPQRLSPGLIPRSASARSPTSSKHSPVSTEKSRASPAAQSASFAASPSSAPQKVPPLVMRAWCALRGVPVVRRRKGPRPLDLE